MSLAWYATSPPQSGVNTTMSESGLVVMSIVAMICLAALLIPVNLASRARRRPGRPLCPREAPPWLAACIPATGAASHRTGMSPPCRPVRSRPCRLRPPAKAKGRPARGKPLGIPVCTVARSRGIRRERIRGTVG